MNSPVTTDRVTRSRDSHMTLTARGDQHRVTVPRHRDLRIGTAGRAHRRCGCIPRSAQAGSTQHPLRLM